jgi:NAD(P)-dependent dehydrogenase (short-subunit alcohol dehydrogenase family)
LPEPVDPNHLLLIGAGPGVGAGVVRRFGREGFRSTLISRSETLDQLAPELRSGGLEIEAIGADIEDLDGYRETLERIFGAPGAPVWSCTTLPCQIQARSSTPRSSGSEPPTTSMSSAPSSRHR